MKGFTSENRLAQDLQEDDWFRVGGLVARVAEVHKNHPSGFVMLKFYLIAETSTKPSARQLCTLVIKSRVPIKTYNQK